MTIKIETKYLIYGGLLLAAGAAYWYLKSQGYWDTWFNAQGNVIPVGALPTPQPQGFQVPGVTPSADTPKSGYVN